MYFWNITALKQQLINSGLPELDSLKYLILLSLIGMIPIPKPPYFSTGTFLYYVFGAIIFIFGTVYCYRRNGGQSGKDFLARFVSLSWVVAMRFLPSLILFGAIIAFGTFSQMAPTQQKVVVIGVNYMFYIVYYWRIAHHISDLSVGTNWIGGEHKQL